MNPSSSIGPGPQPTVNNPSATQTQARFNEGLVLHRKGLLAQAQEIYQQVLLLQPTHFEALHLLGVIAAQSKNYQRAVDFISRAIEIDPNNAMTYFNRGNALNDLGRHHEAVENFDKSISLKPDYAKAYLHRGKVSYALGLYQSAIQNYDQAMAINPGIAETYYERGNAFLALRLYRAAADNYLKAIHVDCNQADVYVNLAVALGYLGQHQVAIENCDKAISLQPSHAGAYSNRGSALLEMRQYSAAANSYAKAFTLKPETEFLLGLLLQTKTHICDWNDVINLKAELIRRIQLRERTTPPFPVLSLTTSLQLQRQAAETWASAKYPANFELGSIPKHLRAEKICIGYFSADFHNHATAYLMAGLLEQHDKDRFELVLFSFGPDVHDEMRMRISTASNKFIDVSRRSDVEIAQLCRSMGVSIAIDLKGFTQGDRSGIFSHRATPIQVSYLGYPGTMGADYIDYLIADKTLIPEDSQRHYSEKIVYLPNSYQVNDTQRKIAEKVFSREELGLPRSDFVFCCFNNNYKITPGSFHGWMRILKQVNGSVLWLIEDNPSAASNLRREAELSGVDPQRLVFAKRMPLPEHLARHHAADLFIDTLPCNAHTTASDALWAGLPVLTCTGEAFASRVAASLLTAIDLPELITSTQEDYEALAVELAMNPDRLGAIRKKLARNRLTTPLFDTKLFTRHIEDAYTQMMDRYHADLPPDHIHVGRRTDHPGHAYE